MRSSESGSAIIYILIAVALLAALSWFVMQGSRTGSSSLTSEQASLAASEIIEYGNTVAQAVQKLKLRGCSDIEISFENTIDTNYTNGSSPSDKSCHIFDLNGGAINFVTANSSWLTSGTTAWRFSGSKNNSGTKSGDGDLVAYLSVNPEICSAINDKLNITPAGNFPTDGSGVFLIEFTGSYGTGSPINNSDSSISNKLSACVEATAISQYLVYVTLISR